VALVRQQTPQPVRAAAGFHGNHAGRQLRREAEDRLPPHAPAQHHSAAFVQAHDAAAVLAEINPKDHDGHGPLLLSSAGAS
jgi:hypothetical protein